MSVTLMRYELWMMLSMCDVIIRHADYFLRALLGRVYTTELIFSNFIPLY